MTTASKLKLVYKQVNQAAGEMPCSLLASHMQPWVSEYFDLADLWDADYYDPVTTVFLANAYQIRGWNFDDYWYSNYMKYNDRAVVLDNLFENQENTRQNLNHNIYSALILTCQDWFWIHEALLIKYLKHQYFPRKNFSKLALMPMNVDRYHRRDVLVELAGLLDHMHWSYVSKGKTLPNDLDSSAVVLDGHAQRHFNPEWYDDTCLSVVIETSVADIDKPFLTEKTYKPIAYKHPFMILGNQGTLAHLKSLGFMTFDHLWDENYDQVSVWHDRLDLIRKNLYRFKTTVWPQWLQDNSMDAETQRRVQHNHNLFFNMDIVKTKFCNEVITPIFKYAVGQNTGKSLPSTVCTHLSQSTN